jgi:hypothetical protein
MINSAAVAILVCLEFVTPQGFDENCEVLAKRSMQVMEQFELQPEKVRQEQEKRVSLMAQIAVENQCVNHKDPAACKKAGMALAHMVWEAIIAGAHDILKSHTA